MSWEWITEVYDCECGEGAFFTVSGENDWFQHEDYGYGGCLKCNKKGKLIRKVFNRDGKHFYGEGSIICPKCKRDFFPVIHIGKHQNSFNCSQCGYEYPSSEDKILNVPGS